MENNRHKYLLISLVALLVIVGGVIWFFAGKKEKDTPTPKTNGEQFEISALNGYGVSIKTHPELGQYLAGPSGMALYITTRKDCTRKCLEAWKPYIVSAPEENGGGVLSTVARGNGYQQTYNGVPLYYYRLDEKIGDVKGHSLDGEWFMARP